MSSDNAAQARIEATSNQDLQQHEVQGSVSACTLHHAIDQHQLVPEFICDNCTYSKILY